MLENLEGAEGGLLETEPILLNPIEVKILFAADLGQAQTDNHKKIVTNSGTG